MSLCEERALSSRALQECEVGPSWFPVYKNWSAEHFEQKNNLFSCDDEALQRRLKAKIKKATHLALIALATFTLVKTTAILLLL